MKLCQIIKISAKEGSGGEKAGRLDDRDCYAGAILSIDQLFCFTENIYY